MIVVDVPREWLLNANQRLHWARKARTTANLRAVGKGAGLSARKRAQEDYEAGRTSHTVYPYPHRVRAVVSVLWPDRRRRDADNIRPTIKALIDGMVEAGILADDDDKHLVGPDLRPSEDRCLSWFACSLIFTFEPVA